ncbi:MAG: glutathione S-transferase domain-containing protein [Candidatus Binatia bacterium]|nr:glutathione S-transferase domain-containing protein [Candidatus Binatia bacterium]
MWRHKITEDGVVGAREKIRFCLDRIECEIQPSGYLAGSQFSVADLTAAALGRGEAELDWIQQPPFGFASTI